MVIRQTGYQRLAFPAIQVMTHGGLVSPTLFNVVVDNVIHTWLAITVEGQRLAHDRLGDAVGRCLGLFYAYDGMFGSRDPEWLHHLMNVLVGLFQRYALAANVAKSRMMTCQPSALMSGMSTEAKALNCMGVVYSYYLMFQR